MCAQVAGNASITARASLWKAVREVLSDPYQGGRVRMETLISKTGNRRVFVAHRRESILETVTTKPILMLDGTMPVEINKLFLPRLMVHPPIRVIAEHQTVAQIIGKGGKGGWGKSRLTRDSAFCGRDSRLCRPSMPGQRACYHLQGYRGEVQSDTRCPDATFR